MNQELLNFAKVISDPTRLRLLNHLKKECCVGELWKKLDLPQNLTSHHLKVLREAKLVNAEKRGLKVVYCLDKAVLSTKLKKLGAYLL